MTATQMVKDIIREIIGRHQYTTYITRVHGIHKNCGDIDIIPLLPICIMISILRIVHIEFAALLILASGRILKFKKT